MPCEVSSGEDLFVDKLLHQAYHKQYQGQQDDAHGVHGGDGLEVHGEDGLGVHGLDGEGMVIFTSAGIGQTQLRYLHR